MIEPLDKAKRKITRLIRRIHRKKPYHSDKDGGADTKTGYYKKHGKRAGNRLQRRAAKQSKKVTNKVGRRPKPLP